MQSVTTILLTEDDETIRTSAAMFLEDNDFVVHQASNGIEALEALSRVPVQVVITDIRMPQMDGFELIEQIGQTFPELPIIVMSGTGELKDVVRALRFGVWDFIMKPIADMNILLHSINKSIEKAALIDENRRTRRELETANKELQSFNYSVSHDLRSPLHAIDAFSEMLEEDCATILPAQSLDHLRRIRKATSRMAQMIDDLLMLSRVSRQELEKVPFDISAKSSQIIENLKLEHPQSTAIADIQENIWVEADPGLIANVLENLIGNAWKYSSKNNDPKISIGSCVTEKGLAIFVKDNGAGFQMKQYERLFGVFQRLHLDSEFSGTGVGLAIAKRIIQRHGGMIWAESEVNAGATFYFTLSNEPG